MTSASPSQSEFSFCSHFFKRSNFSDCIQYFRKGQYYSCKRSLLKCLNDMKQAKMKKEEKENVENSFCLVERESSPNVMHLEWVLRHNILMCNIMEFSNSSIYHEQVIEMTKTEDAFVSLFQELHGVDPSSDQLTLEIGASYNLLSWLLRNHINELNNSIPKFWPYIQRSLERVYFFATRDKPFMKCNSFDDIMHLIPGIIHHSRALKKETSEIIFLLYYCLLWVMIVFQKLESSRFLLKMMERFIRKKKEPLFKDETYKFFWIHPLSLSQSAVPSRMELVILGRICYHMANGANRKDLPIRVDEITCSLWTSFISYLKAYILFQRKMYDEALDAVYEIWKKGTAEKWIKARICNLIGCCFEKQEKYQMAKEWFSKAVAADSTYILPLLNIVMVFKKNGDKESELKALKLLVQATFVDRSKLDSVTLKNKTYMFHINQPDPEVFHWQAVYLLALRYSDLQMYNESSVWFLKLVDILKETSALKIPVHNGYLLPSSLHTIMHQAAYALLRANRFIECIGICNLAIENYTRKNENINSDSKEPLHSKPLLDINFSKYLDSPSLLDSGNDALDDGETADVKNSDTCGLTELINSSLTNTERKSSQELQLFSVDVMSYFIKIAALFHLGNDEESLEDLKRLRATFMTECPRNAGLDNEDITSESEETSHCAKRVCSREYSQEKQRRKSRYKKTVTETSGIFFIKSQIYNNMAIVHIKHGHLDDAAHFLQLAQICFPENLDSIYNFTLLLLKMGKRDEASAAWKTARSKGIWEFSSFSLTSEKAQEMDEVFSD